MMRNLRKKDRELPKESALAITDKCAYAVMATVNEDGSPYCVPMSMAREGEWLYFHCAKEGQKNENLKRQSLVCVSCVGNQKVIPGAFSLEYESAIIAGTASEVTGREEKIRALELICRRYTPEEMSAFDKAVESGIEATAVFKIHIDGICGKGRKP
jgi:nitroimidazol reductase NimA-like FMN-containing flavoprotein (pyridoxamine 5'-phosphate oxidase superfamily)